MNEYLMAGAIGIPIAVMVAILVTLWLDEKDGKFEKHPQPSQSSNSSTDTYIVLTSSIGGF